MLSKFSVKKPFTVLVAIIIVIILGVVSYTKMTVDLIPSLNLPYAVIVTTYGGASPEQVETMITSPLEQTLASISNIQTMSSTSMENVSMIMMEFAGETNMDSAMIEMREQMDMFTSNPSYPSEAGSPMIIKVSMNLMPVEVLTASISGMEQAAATQFIEDKILPEIKSVGGVASVNATGLLENMADVTLSKEKIDKLSEDVQSKIEEQMMAAVKAQLGPEIEKGVKEALASYGIRPTTPGYDDMFKTQYDAALEEAMPGALEMAQSQLPSDGSMDFASKLNADMIKGILSADNFAMPAGSVVDNAGYSYAVKVGDKYATIQEFGEQILFNIPGYGDVKISDIANITEYNNLDTLYSKVNGNPAVMFVLMKQPEYSTADVTDSVAEKIDELIAQYDGLEISVLMNQGEYVNIMINSISQNLLIGAALAIIILVIFLRRFRPTVIVGASILISLVFAIVLMYLGGVSMNLVSMGGLLLAVGMLVDNSIVVIENIFRLRGEGKSPREAAIEGAGQVSGAITASTLTTIVVFVPIVFTTGLTKQLFTDMALTIGFSLVASLLVALTLVPSTTASIKSSKKDSRVIGSHKLANFYANMLEKTLKTKWLTILVAVALLGGSIAAAFASGVELFPSMDNGQVALQLDIPETYSWDERVEALNKVNDVLLSEEVIETLGIMDTSGSTNAESSMMSMMMGGSGTTSYIILKEDRGGKTTTEVIDELRADLDAANLGFEFSISSSGMDMSMLSGSAISISLYGNNLDELRRVTEDVAEIVRNTEGTDEVEATTDTHQSELRIVVDKQKAMLKGLTVAQVFQSVYSNISSPSAATRIDNSDGTKTSIYVKDENTEYNTDTIGDIDVGSGLTVSDIAEIMPKETFKSINHTDQQRYTGITGNLLTGYETLKVNKEIEDKLANYDFPAGIRYEVAGESESIANTFKDLFMMILLAVIFVYLVMVAQFQSLLEPFIVMFTLPLAATGGFLALWMSGSTISTISLIGFVVLAGVIVNNGIVFVDYANQMRATGLSVKDALVKTGRDRLRPILMTALTTIIAMITTIFGSGTGSEMIKPMAVVNVGGLLYGTLLTLFVVPAIYGYFIRDKKDKRDTMATAPKKPAPQPALANKPNQQKNNSKKKK